MHTRAVIAALLLVACHDAEQASPSLPEIEVSSPRPRSSTEMTGSGSALARLADDSALVVADEDHGVLRRVPLPVDVRNTVDVIAMPGAPAQVVALGDRILVTVREPGMLLDLAPDTLRERARIDLPSDAWGIAVSAGTAIVTSAWTHRATGIDLDTMKVRWSLVMAREPRGIAIADDGTAYVSHLTGSRITKIAGIHGDSPSAERIEVAPSPLRAPPGQLLDASLGYTAVLSPDGRRLFLPRHALGAQGAEWWFGQPTVDVLLTHDQTSLAPRLLPGGSWADFKNGDLLDVQSGAPIEDADFVQPRAAVYRRSTHTLLVAGEGNNVLAELDARALDPSLATKRVHRLARYQEAEWPYPNIAKSCGAPSAIALSADEKMAWVFCRSTYDLAIVALDEEDDESAPFVHLADDTLDEEGAKGRRLFYDATDATISGGLGCAGCHPEGRDDGHVWHEIDGEFEGFASATTGYRGTTVASSEPGGGFDVRRGVPRQTPMLAGRMGAYGPYGWRGESKSLEDRIRAGFSLHRWGGTRKNEWVVAMDRPKVLAAFLREGLVAPKAAERPLTTEEERGKWLFSHENVGCASCHAPAREFTDRRAVSLGRGAHPGFDSEPDVNFKTPSLLFVGGTAPYYHDGTALTLEALVSTIGRSMGDTTQLPSADQQALAAYLRTIGGYVEPFPDEAPPALPRAPKAYANGDPLPRAPEQSAWTTAELVFAKHRSGCEVRRIDVWMHIACPREHEIALVAGSKRGIQRWVGARTEEFGDVPPPRLVFPLRRGDRRVIQLTTEEAFGRWSVQTVSAGVLSAHWLEGEAKPTIVLD